MMNDAMKATGRNKPTSQSPSQSYFTDYLRNKKTEKKTTNNRKNSKIETYLHREKKYNNYRIK